MISNAQYEKTDVKAVPKGWKYSYVNDIAKLKKKSYSPSADSNLPYIGLEHINQGSLSLNGVGNSSDVISNKYYFNRGDILFGKLRPYFRKVFQPKFDGVCSTDIWVVAPKEGNDGTYLFYFMANEDFVNLAIAGSTGTRMPRADWDQIRKSQWYFPQLNEQEQIASILSSLDDKIELNRRMNKTLEEIGKALFKRWFVDFEFPNENGDPYKSSGGEMVESELGEIPKGWKKTKLENIISITSGKRPLNKADVLTSSNSIPIIGASGVMGYTSKILYDEKIICTGRVGTLGIVQKINYPCWMSDNALVINSDFYEFVYFTLSSVDFTSYNVGSTQPLITQSSIKNTEILMPNKDLLQRFEEIASMLTLQITANSKEIHTIQQIRDSLLPRLMSGKIRV